MPESDFSLAARLEMPVVKEYPATSTCWVCGHVQQVTGHALTWALRRCDRGHDEVTWKDELVERPALVVDPGSLTSYANRPWNRFLRDLQPGSGVREN